ncbi:chromosome partitioning ATPase [Anopheles sinensis]|uniref:Chromosome partitioning ATPase n=1 Tax=Anopheles sinensis TaxID=74873 RepID=A0A084WUC0_ANOSI|nr:chromosome partitioning ATPase [Anopheles sinensis]
MREPGVIGLSAWSLKSEVARRRGRSTEDNQRRVSEKNETSNASGHPRETSVLWGARVRSLCSVESDVSGPCTVREVPAKAEGVYLGCALRASFNSFERTCPFNNHRRGVGRVAERRKGNGRRPIDRQTEPRERSIPWNLNTLYSSHIFHPLPLYCSTTFQLA